MVTPLTLVAPGQPKAGQHRAAAPGEHFALELRRAASAQRPHPAAGRAAVAALALAVHPAFPASLPPETAARSAAASTPRAMAADPAAGRQQTAGQVPATLGSRSAGGIIPDAPLRAERPASAVPSSAAGHGTARGTPRNLAVRVAEVAGRPPVPSAPAAAAAPRTAQGASRPSAVQRAPAAPGRSAATASLRANAGAPQPVGQSDGRVSAVLRVQVAGAAFRVHPATPPARTAGSSRAAEIGNLQGPEPGLPAGTRAPQRAAAPAPREAQVSASTRADRGSGRIPNAATAVAQVVPDARAPAAAVQPVALDGRSEIAPQVAAVMQQHLPDVAAHGPAVLRMALNPPSLGHISISLSAGAGGITAVLRAELPVAMQLMQAAQPEIRRRLQDLGLGDASVRVAGFGDTPVDRAKPDGRRR